MPSQPIVKSAIADITAAAVATDQVLDLLTHFDDPLTTGKVAEFKLYDTSLGNGGITKVVLYDQEGAGAPLSVANFISYVESEAYTNSIIHRALPGFVIQGGGFTVENLANNLSTSTPANAVSEVTSNSPVQNEFSSGRSNLRGTLAFAKLGGQPDSATNQWFFNLDDNAVRIGANGVDNGLDSQNEGFTVFGEVVSEADLLPVDAIAALPTLNDGQGRIFGQTAFSNLPLITDSPSTFTFTDDNDFVRYESITVSQEDELSFEVVSNSKPNLVTPSISNNQLVLDYNPAAVDNNRYWLGQADLTIRATNLQGQTIDDSFSIKLTDSSLDGVFNPVQDFNRDGSSEVLWQSKSTGGILAWNMLDNRVVGTQNVSANVPSLDWDVAGAMDFDFDGNLDLLSRNLQTGEINVWLLDENRQQIGTVDVTPQQRPGLEWQLEGVADFNGDHRPDILWRHKESGQFLAWHLGGDQSESLAGGVLFDLSLIGLGADGVFPDLGWQVEATGDFDGDGDGDLVWRHQATGDGAIWLMEQGQLVGGYGLPRVADLGWEIIGSGDFNGDRKADLLWQHKTAGEVLLWSLDQGQVIDFDFIGAVNVAAWQTA